ncbi:DDE-type integrase/transposase/recombinase [soil metagenome]
MNIHALHGAGWRISEIARHVGRDPKTVRAYLNGERTPGVRRSAAPDPLEPFVDYVRARFVDDHTIWASALFDEVVALGYGRSYVTFARQVRLRGLRPHCEACQGVRGRDTIEIDHPPGDETQWDWFERRRARWGGTAYVLLGTLPHSSRVRAVLSPSMDQPHLIDAMDGVMRRFGGVTRVWRTDRLATVINPHSGDVQASFAPVAKHYGAVIEACPAGHAWRKGSVESSVRFVSGRWWKTLTATTPQEAQLSLDRFCETVGDARMRPIPSSWRKTVLSDAPGTPQGHPDDGWVRPDRAAQRVTVGELADTEPLRPLPITPYPATITTTSVVAANATVAFRGNRYSVPPGLTGTELTLSHRLGTGSVEVTSPAGGVLVSHRLAPAGAGMIVRTTDHHRALEAVVLSGFTTDTACDPKRNSPPGPDALAAAARLLGDAGRDVVVDLGAYERLAGGHR